MHYLLDACAILVICNEETGAHRVLGLLGQVRTGAVRLSMSIIQLLEVYYDRIYVAGENEARIIIESIFDEPITIIDTISYQAMYEAGRLKASYSISLADSIACAIAKNFDATLVTKDKEIKTYQQDSRGCDDANRYYSYLFASTPRGMAIGRFARTGN